MIKSRISSIDGLVGIDPDPCDGISTSSHPKNHHVLRRPHCPPLLADVVSVGDVDGIVATVGIELAPGGGLDCKGWHGVVVCHVAIVGDRPSLEKGRCDTSKVVLVIVVHDVAVIWLLWLFIIPAGFFLQEHVGAVQISNCFEIVHLSLKNFRKDSASCAITMQTSNSNIRRTHNQRRNLSPHCYHERTTESPSERCHQ